MNSTAIVRQVTQRLLEQREIVSVKSVVQAVLEQKSDIYGDDLPFYQRFAIEEIKRQAKKAMSIYKPKAETDKQLVLDGFEHLQIAYPMVREGEYLLIPTDLCTDEELLARASEYGQMARGCLAHQKEIRGFVAERKAA